MPKSTNDSIEKKVTKKVKKEDKIVEEKAKKVGTTAKKANTDTKTSAKKDTKKASTNKASKATTKSTEKAKKTSTKVTTKKSSKTSTAKPKTQKKETTTKKKKSTKNSEILTSVEYYDLPYRYNQTIVKILAQTPNTLFIYWDISDEDRKKLEENYGNDFFSKTKPVLIIHNETKNYSFEIDINDFANSWYLNISDTDCKYNIELGRRFIDINNTQNENAINTYKNNNYIYISSSNKLITPNDHILNFNKSVQFKNIKNNTYYLKEIKNVPFLKLYKEFYSRDLIDSLPFNNPSSSFKNS